MPSDDRDLFLVLGCFGLSTGLPRGNFISCPGTENRILKIDVSLRFYNEIMDYLDTCRLFDRPLFELSSIKHFIFNLRDRYDQIDKKIWSEQEFELYQKFVINHRVCGLYLKLELLGEEDQKSVELEEKSVFISGSKPLSQEPEVKNVVPLRGRR